MKLGYNSDIKILTAVQKRWVLVVELMKVDEDQVSTVILSVLSVTVISKDDESSVDANWLVKLFLSDSFS